MQIINGIAIIDNAFSDDTCKSYIEHFENNPEHHYVGNFCIGYDCTSSIDETLKTAIEMKFPIEWLSDTFNTLMIEYLEKYVGDVDWDYTSLWYHGSRYSSSKCKKYIKGVGHYNHIHQEKDGFPDLKNRLFSLLLYLNNVAEGGETVFPLHEVSVKPETGKLVIFPPGFPYLHYATMPISDHKYAINSWLEMTYEK